MGRHNADHDGARNRMGQSINSVEKTTKPTSLASELHWAVLQFFSPARIQAVPARGGAQRRLSNAILTRSVAASSSGAATWKCHGMRTEMTRATSRPHACQRRERRPDGTGRREASGRGAAGVRRRQRLGGARRPRGGPSTGGPDATGGDACAEGAVPSADAPKVRGRRGEASRMGQEGATPASAIWFARSWALARESRRILRKSADGPNPMPRCLAMPAMSSQSGEAAANKAEQASTRKAPSRRRQKWDTRALRRFEGEGGGVSRANRAGSRTRSAMWSAWAQTSLSRTMSRRSCLINASTDQTKAVVPKAPLKDDGVSDFPSRAASTLSNRRGAPRCRGRGHTSPKGRPVWITSAHCQNTAQTSSRNANWATSHNPLRLLTRH